MVGLGGLEPPASSLSGTRSNQLSYKPTSHPHPQAAKARGREGRLIRTRVPGIGGSCPPGDERLEKRYE